MTGEPSRFERMVIDKLPGHPGITAQDLALRLGMGVLPTLQVLASMRARGIVARRVEWHGDKPRDIQPARWSAIVVEDQRAA